MGATALSTLLNPINYRLTSGLVHQKITVFCFYATKSGAFSVKNTKSYDATLNDVKLEIVHGHDDVNMAHDGARDKAPLMFRIAKFEGSVNILPDGILVR